MRFSLQPLARRRRAAPRITSLYCSQLGVTHSNQDMLEANRRGIYPRLRSETQELYEKLLGKDPVRTRKFLVPYERVFELGAVGKSELFLDSSRRLLADAGWGLLHRSGVLPSEIDFLIVTYMAGKSLPSLNAHVSHELGLRTDVVSLTLGDMGCSSAVAAIDLAARLLRAERGPKRALVMALEPVTALFQTDDDQGSVVGNTLFGEGCGAVIVSSFDEPALYHIGPSQRTLLATERALGSITLAPRDSGPMICLSKDIPEVASEAVTLNLRKLVPRLASTRQKLSYFVTKKIPRWQARIDHWAIHPGGGAVLRAMEQNLKLAPADLGPSYRVYRERSNMSSPSVLYALENIEKAGPKVGDRVLMMGFGSGFKVNSLVLHRGSLQNSCKEELNAVVVGGTSGIGLEVSRALSRRGVRVFIGSRRVGHGCAYEQLEGCTYLPLDVTDPDSVARFAEDVWQKTFGVDVLVVSSGIAGESRAVGKLDAASVQQTVATNLTGAMLVTNALLPKVRQHGHVIMLNSILGRIPLMGNATYCATKAGLLHFCESVKLELARTGRKVSVTSLFPAYVETPMLDAVKQSGRTLLAPISAARVAEQVLRVIDGRGGHSGFLKLRDQLIASVYHFVPRAFRKIVAAL